MKKFIFAIAVLVALAMAACVFTAPEVEAEKAQVVYTEDGKALVKLGVGLTAGSRALTDNMAMVAAERYEVAFYSADTLQVYRTTWVDGQRGNLWVYTEDSPGIDYAAGGNRAILFAGYSNGTLLAVGELTSVDGAPGAVILNNSRAVTFSLTALNNDIFGLDGGSTMDPTKSTFQITQATFETNLLSAFEVVPIDGENYPVYELDPGLSTVTATYKVTGFPVTPGIVVAAAPKIIPKMIEVPGYWSAKDVTGSFTGLSAGSDLPAPAGTPLTTTFSLSLITRSNHGLIKIGFQIPVYAISAALGYDKLTNATDVQPGTWYIRGGIANSDLDRGTNQDSDGGSVLIGVGVYERPSQVGWINVD